MKTVCVFSNTRTRTMQMSFWLVRSIFIIIVTTLRKFALTDRVYELLNGVSFCFAAEKICWEKNKDTATKAHVVVTWSFRILGDQNLRSEWFCHLLSVKCWGLYFFCDNKKFTFYLVCILLSFKNCWTIIIPSSGRNR